MTTSASDPATAPAAAAAPDAGGAAGAAGAAAEPTYKYWGFISYSHADETWAKWVHRSLETYRAPRSVAGRKAWFGAVPSRVSPVFRDRDELPGASELNEQLQVALRQSRYLVVICSPKSAVSRWVNEEIKTFKSVRPENQQRVLCLIVDGEPNASDRPDSGELECFPPAIRFRTDAAGQLTTERTDPIAADARKNKDGKGNALLKLLSGILCVGYDELRRRERARALRRRVRFYAACGGGVVLMGFGYVLTADSGLAVPGGEGVRRALDRHRLSLLRPVHSDAEVRRTAAGLRRQLLDEMAAHRTAGGWLPRSFHPAQGMVNDTETWTHSQALAAVLHTPDARDGDLRTLAPALGLPFGPPGRPGSLIESNGVKYGWTPYPEKDDVTTAQPALWTAIALGAAAARPGLLTPDDRRRCEEWLADTQQVLRNYRPKGSAGGWAMFPLQDDPAVADPYTTALALTALLEARRAGLPWDGSPEARDALLAAAADWLIQRFDPTGDPPGWQGTGNSAGVVFDGMTLQIYATLLRAEAEAGVAVPPALLDRIPAHLIACTGRTMDYPLQGQKFYSRPFTNHAGVRIVGSETVSLVWYPWAIDCGARWLDRAAKRGAAPEQLYRVRRAQGHLVVDLGPEAERRAASAWVFVASEMLYGLSSVPPP